MSIKLGVVMDPIADITYKKDTTLAMLWAAQDRNWSLFYMEPPDLYLDQGVARANMQPLQVFRDPEAWYQVQPVEDRAPTVVSALNVATDRLSPRNR